MLYGYYHVPDRSHKPIDFIINPEGIKLRSRKRCGSEKHPARYQAAFAWDMLLLGTLHAPGSQGGPPGMLVELQAISKSAKISPEGMELRSRKRCGSAAGSATSIQHSV